MNVISTERKLAVAVAKITGANHTSTLKNCGYAASVVRAQHLPPELENLIVKYAGLFQLGICEGTFNTVSPQQIGKILGKIILEGKDFDKVNAIKTLGQIILKGAEKVGNTINQNVFILPDSPSEKQKEIVETQIVEDQRLNKMTHVSSV